MASTFRLDVAVASTQPSRLRLLRLEPRLLVGSAGLAVIVVSAVFAPLLAPYNPLQLHLPDRLHGPSHTYLLGTDYLGRDTLSRLMYGLRPTLLAGLVAISLAAIFGILMGVVSGFFGRWVDAIISRVLDLILAWPAIFLALAIVLLLGPGETDVVLAIGLAELPVFARLVRAITLANVNREHVVAARSMGASAPRLIGRHIFPFALAPLVVQFAISAPQAALAEASLNYLGLGTQPPKPSLGAMLAEAQSYISYSATGVIFPVLVISLLVLSLTLIADALQDGILSARPRGRA